MYRRAGLICVCVLAISFQAAQAWADVFTGAMIPGRLHTVQGATNGEVAVGSNFALKPNAPLQAGDFLVGAINIPSVNRIGAAPLQVDFDGPHVNAFFITKVKNVTNVAGMTADFEFEAATTAEWNSIISTVFGASPAGDALRDPTVGTAVIGFEAPGEFLAFDGGTLDDLISPVFAGGTKIFELGFGDSSGWVAEDVPLIPLAAGQSITAGVEVPNSDFNFALQVLWGLDEFDFLDILSGVPDGLGGFISAPFVGGGSLLGIGDQNQDPINAFHIASNVNFSFAPVLPQTEVPEPASLVIWGGLAALGMGAYRRRKK